MTTSRRSKVLSGGFFALLLVLAGVGYRVGLAAQDAILESRSGSISQFSLDPTAPGFRAFTEPTPTALVVHTAVSPGLGAELVGVTLLTSADGEAGGTVVTIPRTFVHEGGNNRPLSEVFVTSGLDALTEELGRALGIGFADVVVLDASSWTTLMQADLPLDLTLRDDLILTSPPEGQDRILVASGTRSFELLDVARIAAHRNQGEPGLAVALRHQSVWKAWISRTAGSTERPALFQLESGFVDLISSLASGEVSYRVVPFATVAGDSAEATTYVGQDDRIADLISQIVPFPQPAEAGDRVEVLLLDATLGAADSSPVIESIVRAGGRVTILGNTEANSDAVSEVQVHDPSAVAVGESIVDLVGLGPVRMVPLDSGTASITVVVGADQLAAQ